VRDTGTVVFFLYFANEHACETVRAALLQDGYRPREILPPDDPADPTWSLAAERELHTDDVAEAVDRVRAAAEAAGGELDGIVTPWPSHPHGFPPQRPPRS
jgi:hypothetical protein